MTTTTTAPTKDQLPTDEQCEWMRGELQREFPHLTMSVETREGKLYVEGLPAVPQGDTAFAGASIVCPSWCVLSADEHLAEYEPGMRAVLHRSEDWCRGDTSVGLSREALPDGTPYGEADSISASSGEMTLDDAEAFAKFILAIVEMARS